MEIEEIFEEVNDYLGETSINFNDEWKCICNIIYKEFDGGDLYGKALIKYSNEINKNEKLIIELKELIESYDREVKFFQGIKETLYFNLGIIWHSLGEMYDNEAINAFKKYIYYLYDKTNNTSFSLQAYAFRSCNQFLYKSLINEQLNLSSPSVFNDPFDCPITVLLKKYDEEVNNLLLKAYNDCLKIACFSCKNELSLEEGVKCSDCKDEYLNALMWAHYADSHKGICIKYYFGNNMTKGVCDLDSGKKISYFRNVIYSDDAMNKLVDDNNNSIDATKGVFLKGKCWEYENELRYMELDVEGTGTHKQIDIPNCISAVYFGLRCSQSDKDTIMKILKGRKCDKSGNEIEFYQMEMDETCFGQLKAKRIIEETKKGCLTNILNVLKRYITKKANRLFP